MKVDLVRFLPSISALRHGSISRTWLLGPQEKHSRVLKLPRGLLSIFFKKRFIFISKHREATKKCFFLGKKYFLLCSLFFFLSSGAWNVFVTFDFVYLSLHDGGQFIKSWLDWLTLCSNPATGWRDSAGVVSLLRV